MPSRAGIHERRGVSRRDDAATGVRQVFEAYQQLSEKAGARQIENARRFLTFNMGGSLTTSVAMVWGRG